MTDNVSRQARYRDRLRAQGVQQVLLLAPADSHDALRQIAARLRAGKPLHSVLQAAALAVRRGATVAPVVPAELVPGVGEAAVAVRLGKTATGYRRRRLVEQFNLDRDRSAGAWVGILPAHRVPALRAFVDDAGGGQVVIRGPGATA